MSLDISRQWVFITGASSGMGKAAAYHFAEQGANLILTARRLERIEALAKALKEKYSVEACPVQLDVQDKTQVATVIQSIIDAGRSIDILINNAGVALESTLIQEGDSEHWDTMIDTNFRGLLYITREALPHMLAQNSGHIINVGSTAGHEYYPTGNVYCATKHAVKAISKSLRLDLLGTAIRVTEIDPGSTQTEFSAVRWQDQQRSDAFYADFNALTADDIADAMVYCATRPLHVDVAEMVIYPTCQASCNHIHKNGEATRGIFD